MRGWGAWCAGVGVVAFSPNFCIAERRLLPRKLGAIQKKIIFAYFFPQKVAVIAQLVEHFTRNEKVSGSSPDYGSPQKKTTACHESGRRLFFYSRLLVF